MLKRRNISAVIAVTLLLAIVAFSCGRPDPASTPPSMRLATTSPIDASGLLQEILPDFQETHGVTIEIIVAGAEEALALAERGEVDLVFVDAPQREAAFIEEEFGVDRREILRNDFVVVGPGTDPAGIRSAPSVMAAFTRIVESRALFISRGDQSETHRRELAIWSELGTALDPLTGWYQSLGQGAGETLDAANEERAYTFTDRATYIRAHGDLPELVMLLENGSGDPDLRNIASVIQVNPERHPNVNADLAQSFIMWITSPDVQEMIAGFGMEQYGEPLFLPVEGP